MTPLRSRVRRVRERPREMLLAADFPAAASRPFYTRLSQLLAKRHFDDFVEAQCRPF